MKHFLILTRLQLRCLLSSLQVGRGNRKRAVSGWAALAFLSALSDVPVPLYLLHVQLRPGLTAGPGRGT